MRADPYKVPIEAARMVCHPGSIWTYASYFKDANRLRDLENRAAPLHHREPHGRWLGVCGGNYFRALGRGGGLLPLAALLRSTRADLATKIFGAPA